MDPMKLLFRPKRSGIVGRLPVLGFALLVGCAAEQIAEHVELAPAAEQVEFAYESPSPNAYKMVGNVRGVAAGVDADSATDAARNDLRNKAAALGATVVTIDQNIGEPILLLNKTKVTLVGRAFKAVD
jgi:hypothetical protein